MLKFLFTRKDTKLHAKMLKDYPLMAITSSILLGSSCLRVASIPFFSVIVDDGHPLQAP